MIERTVPEAVPGLKQLSGTEHALGFNPSHLMEPTTDYANIDTDSDAREAYYRALAPALFKTIG